jgi:signal transduction histidine kinase
MKLFHADITSRWFRSVFSFVLLLLAAVELVILFFINSSLYSNVETYLDRRNEMNAGLFGTLIKENQNDIYKAANSFMNSVRDDGNVRFEIYDKDGRNILSSDGFTSRTLYDVSQANGEKTIIGDENTGEHLMILSSPLRNSGGSVCGAIKYTLSLENVIRLQTIYTVVSLAAVIFVAFLVFLSGQYFIQSIVKPVNTIIDSAQKIAKGDFSIRTQKKYDDEIGKLSDAINNMAQELSKIDMLKNEFISSVSHELRTPLTAIRGWNETISTCDPETDEEVIKKGLSVIDAETDRLGRMIEELLDYSKIQSGRFTISKSKINLFSLLLDTLDIYSQKATSAGISIRYDTPAFEPVVQGDPNRIKQVFINVLDNAVKHSPKNSTVEIYLLKGPGTYSVIFKDHGSGIKKEELPFIKDRFYKGSSTKPGSGLGLSICDEIINLHGGTLDIDSAEAEGTTVAITLPVTITETK